MTPNEAGLAPAAPNEPYVYGVRMPGGDDGTYDKETVAEWLLTLQGSGIRRVVSLMHAAEVEEYELVLEVAYAQMFGRDNVYSDESIEEDELVDADRLLDALSFVQDSVNRKMPVAVHCGESEFRVLQLLALWVMISRNLPAAEAIRMVKESGRRPPERYEDELPDDTELAGHLTEIKAVWAKQQH